MIGKVKSIIQFAPKKSRVNIDVNGVVGKTFIVDGNVNSKYWKGVKVGDCLSGLDWFDEEGKIIDADSKIVVLK